MSIINLATPVKTLTGTLISIINKYKKMIYFTKKNTPLKIIEIISLSEIPGESTFIIQVSNKNSIFKMRAATIISEGFDLNLFNKFHAEIIKHAAKGTLIHFLHQEKTNQPKYRIISKKFEHGNDDYLFTIATKNNYQFTCTMNEIISNKKLLQNLHYDDIYDIGYTTGYLSIIKEKNALALAKQAN